MKITFQSVALSTAALTLAVGTMLAAPVSAKTMHHSKRTMRHHRMSRTSHMHRMSGMHSGSMSKGRMNGSMSGGALGTPAGNANPATSTAPATSGGDKM